MAKAAFSRKHFFIDRNLQGRYMVTFLVPMLIMLAFMLLTLYFASQTIVTTSSRIMKKEIDNTIASQFQDQLEPTAAQYKAALEQVEARVRGFGNLGGMNREFAGTLLGVFGAGILLVVLQIVMMTVFFSHKLAGPVYRFEKMCKDIINGNYKNTIHLRKGDHMQGLALLLNEAARVSELRINELEAKAAELESRLAQCGGQDAKETIAVSAEDAAGADEE